jgi:hypothetical protein
MGVVVGRHDPELRCGGEKAGDRAMQSVRLRAGNGDLAAHQPVNLYALIDQSPEKTIRFLIPLIVPGNLRLLRDLLCQGHEKRQIRRCACRDACANEGDQTSLLLSLNKSFR